MTGWSNSVFAHRGWGAIKTVAPTLQKLVPSASWNGTATTGLQAAGVGFNPALPTRTTAKPVVRIISTERIAITGDYDVLFSVHMAKHVGGYVIQVAWENSFQTVTQTPAKHTYTNPSDGNVYTSGPCYKITLDGSTAASMVSQGAATLSILVTPNDVSLQSRTITSTMYPRTTFNRVTATAGAQTAGSEYDRIIEIYATTGTDVTGSKYYDAAGIGAFDKALTYLNTNSSSNLLVGLRMMTDAGNYRFDQGATNTGVLRNAWTRVFKGSGVNSYMLGDGTNFPTFGSLSFDGLLFEAAKIDLRQISPAFHTFRVPQSTNNLLGFSACEIYHGTNTFGVAASSGAGMTSLYNGNIPPSGWSSSQNAQLLDMSFYECNIHDIAGPAILNTKGVVRNCSVQDVSGTTLKDTPALIHGGTFKRNGGIWSGLRSYWPMIQLVGPTNAQFMISGTSGNTRRLSLTQAIATAWSPNGGVINTTAQRMAIPSSGGSASGLVVFIKNTGGTNVYAKAGDVTVVATTSDTAVSSAQGGAFLTLTGTETHISMVSGGSPNSTITLLRSVFDTAVINTVTQMTAIRDAINTYTATDASWSASMITPAHTTDPVLCAYYMGANLNGYAYATVPTPINSSPPFGAAGVIYCWVDQHGDCFFLDTGTYENYSVEYAEFSQIRGSNIMQLNGGTNNDAAFINVTCVTDDFQIYGQGSSGGAVAGAGNHVFWQNCSYAGGILVISSSWNPDTYCGADRLATYTFGGTGLANMRFDNCSFGKGIIALPQGGALCTNCQLNTTQDDTVRFTFIPTTIGTENTAVNMIPFSPSSLQLPDGTIAGRYQLDGSETTAT